METKKIIIRLLMLIFFIGSVLGVSAQSGNLSLVNSSGTYQVVFTPTSSGAFTLGASSLVAIRADINTFTMPTTVTDVNGGPWTLTSPKQTEGSFDYWGYTTAGNTPLTFVSGTPIILFSFPAPGCSGGTATIVDPNNLPGSGSGIINSYDFGTTINSPVSGNIAGVTGPGVSCPSGFALGMPNPVKNTTTGTPTTGNAATELNPSGGTAPYAYSQDTGSTCVAPSGATPLPTPLTVNSTTGAYSFTAPSTVGTYYYCIKVCDSTTPTPSCSTATYTTSVTAGACAANAGTLN